MDIAQIKLLNDERVKALEQLKLMHARDKEFDEAWNKKLKDATEKFISDFINFFTTNGWEVKESQYGNRTITVKYGMDSYLLNQINVYGRAMNIETGKSYNEMHYFTIGQKNDDPNYIKRTGFEVGFKMLTVGYGGEPDYETFLKRFTTIDDLKQVGEKAKEYMSQIERYFGLIDKIEFYIVPTDGKSFYSSVENYINSL